MKQILLTALLCIFAISANASTSINSSEMVTFNSPQNITQDVIYLKNGIIVKGTIIERTTDQLVRIIAVNGEIRSFRMTEIDRMTKEEIKQADKNAYLNTGRTGYAGFVDFGYTFGIGGNGLSRMEGTTSHGYIFKGQLFLGLGTGAHLFMKESNNVTLIPVFADVRYNFLGGKIVPFVGLKAGYSIGLTNTIKSGTASGIYIAPSVGVKYRITKRIAGNITLGYSTQYLNYQYSQGIGQSLGSQKGYSGGFTIKLGFEF